MRAVVAAGLAALAGWVANARADEPVRIGLEIPLSPPGDPAAGQLIRRGAELAVEYVNGVGGGILGGRKIEPDQDWRQADILLEHAGTAR
jgi:branched-chain amino acid transport system substrate-binding protein